MLLLIADQPDSRLRDMAAALDLTERTAYGIVADLTSAGYLVKSKDGRRNHYEVQKHLPLQGVTSQERTVGELLDLLVGSKSRSRRGRPLRGPRPPG